MRPTVKHPAAWHLIGADEAAHRTGLSRGKLLGLPHVEALERIFADGRREDALRLPAALLPPRP
jgi:hypothetical protein